MTVEVHFENKLPMKRQKKALIGFLIITSIAIATIATISFLFLVPKHSEDDSDSDEDPPDFPTIYIINQSQINKDNPVGCTFELKSPDSSQDIKLLNSNITIRGETSATYPKKGYRLEFLEGKKKSILGMRDDDDWLLFASYYDYTRIRVKLSFEVWRKLLPINPTAILPRSSYVNLYINGKFKGLYLIAEKNDRKLFGIDKTTATNDENSSVILQAKKRSNFTEYDQNDWEQDWPNKFDVRNKTLEDLILFVNNTSNSTFFDPINGIYSKFNKTNLIDFFLFNFFIYHEDFWNKNYFIARNSNTSKFYLIPWDFDISFGQNGTTTYSASDNNETDIRLKNKLFDRLLNNQTFRANCSARWKILRSQIWTNESFSNLISNIYNQIKSYIIIDLRIWNQNDNDVQTYVNDLNLWIAERLAFCDILFEDFSK